MRPELPLTGAGQTLDATLELAPDLPGGLRDILVWDWGMATGRPARRIEVRAASLPAPPPGRVQQTVTVMDTPVQVTALADELWLDDTLHVSVGADHSVLTVGEETSQLLLAVAMTEAHRAAGWLPLHAALIGGAGGAVALLGDSGAGKSTACLRLHAAGHPVLAEDRAWLSPQGLVTGLDRGLRAFDDSVARFAPQWAADEDAPRDAKGKRILPLIQPGALPLRAALLLSDTPLPQGAARVSLAWSAAGLPLTRSARQAAAPMVQRLVRDVPWQGVTRATVLPEVAARLAEP